MLSQSAEYALRAIVFLSANQGSPKTTDEIAAVTKVPTSYLSKILQALTRAKLVNSQRGVRGGFTLARPADGITIMDAIAAVDSHQKLRYNAPILEALSGTGDGGDLLTPLHQLLENSFRAIERTFSDTTIQSLVATFSAKPEAVEVETQICLPDTRQLVEAI